MTGYLRGSSTGLPVPTKKEILVDVCGASILEAAFIAGKLVGWITWSWVAALVTPVVAWYGVIWLTAALGVLGFVGASSVLLGKLCTKDHGPAILSSRV